MKQLSKQWVESWCFSTKESEVDPICRIGHGQRVLGCERDLVKLDVEIHEKRPSLKKKKTSFTRTKHKGALVRGKLAGLGVGFTGIPYSSDLTSIWLLNLNQFVSGKRQ
ncbi:hypothetical protein TNCV_3382191 [Trichonephila clavipes]|nr:hypothetical protein TNCV_3382191 [Trichonephila clavipes]